MRGDLRNIRPREEGIDTHESVSYRTTMPKGLCVNSPVHASWPTAHTAGSGGGLKYRSICPIPLANLCTC